MKIAVVGAGFTGLAVTWSLLKKGHQVTLFEKEKNPGGLAIGFKEPGWEWSLEKHYHHIFESDKKIQNLADEIGHPYKFYDVTTASLFESGKNLEYWPIDSPKALLQFGKLPFTDRVRTGAVVAFMKYLADWKTLEKTTAEQWLRQWNGERAYGVLWKPLFDGKFDAFAPEVNAAWFWARIKARSQRLGYFEGGFLGLATHLLDQIEKHGGKTIMGQEIKDINALENDFDKLIIAGAPNLITQKVNYLGTINVILRLKQDLLPNNIYWLNNHLVQYPPLALVEHTHMIDKSHYNNENLVYIAKYLDHDHPYFKLDDAGILAEYSPLLDRINSSWKKNLIGFSVQRARFTQPVMTRNYSQYIPGFKTDNPKVLAASMQQVYPWDRGTNFAVDLGQKLAEVI